MNGSNIENEAVCTDSVILKYCVQILNDDDVRREIYGLFAPIIDMVMSNVFPYIYLTVFILLFLFLCMFVILGLLVQILRKNIVAI
jgi:hypothetical protein